MQIDTAARLAAKALIRSAREAAYLRTGHNLTKPSDVRATLTERCNYRCGYCNHWRQKSYAGEMSLEEWQAALLSIRQFVGRYAVQFLGGEPMLVPWFTDLASFCHREKIDWGVITNGSTLNPKTVAAIVAAEPLNIDISLDSRDAATHDEMRGIRGSMRHVSLGIRRLVQERERSGHDFTIRIKPTVTRQTIPHLNGIVDWAETMPSVLVDFSPVRLHKDADRAAMYPRIGEDLEYLRQEIEQLVHRKADGAPIETSAAKLRSMIPHFLGQPSVHGVDKCRVGLRSVNVRPNGDVEHCFKFNKLGNLRESSMQDIWHASSRSEVVEQTLACDLIQTTCSTSCLGHRTLAQEIARGISLVKATL